MKTIIKLLAVVILFGALNSGCTKYPDGPKFSLLTKKARISNDWLIEQVTFNGTDITEITKAAAGANYKFIIEKSGSYSVQGNFPDTGKWKFGEDKDDAYFTSDKPGSTEQAFRILRLKSSSLWLRSTASNGDITIFHYKGEVD